jgi:ElaB/YqjD/DUF883 family membrane-anchored ribosome-binding protein
MHFMELIMYEPTSKTINHDLAALANDAHSLFKTAATLSGDKAEEIRSRGMHLLDTMLVKSKEAQSCTIAAGREIASSAADYAKANPWRTIAMVAGAGMLLGAVVARK